MSTFTDKIERLLLEKQISVTEFQQAIKVNKNALSQWKKNGNIPRNAKEIADFLGVTLEYLLDNQSAICKGDNQEILIKITPPTTSTELVEEAISKFNQLKTNESIEKVNEYIEFLISKEK